MGSVKKETFIALAAVIIETSFELAIPYVMSLLIDHGVKNADLPYIEIAGGIISALALLSLVNGLLYSRYAAKAAAGFGFALRAEQFRAIQSYSFRQIDAYPPSSLVTRLINDSGVMQNALASGLRPLVRAPIMLILGIIFSFLINWQLALIFVVLTPILAVVLLLILHNISPKYGAMQRGLDRLNLKVQETLLAIRAVKVFVRGPYEEKKFDAANTAYTDTVKSTFKIAHLNEPAFQLVMYTATILFMLYGGNLISQGTLLPGALAGILSYVMQTFNALMMISSVFVLLAKSLASVYRIDEVLQQKHPEAVAASPWRITAGAIEFRHVNFRYDSQAKENVLSDINLRIAPGETVAIIGATGSGKSSLVQLIPRLYEANEGMVLIDGHDVKDYSKEELHERVGMLLQKNSLFAGTLRANLLWGNPAASDEELFWAIHLARVDEFLPSLEKGLESELGEGGSRLSGGQKQRVCLARSLLKKPRILILDDATSALDSANEEEVRAGLASLEGVSKIIISERILSVKDAQRIYLLDEGKIVDQGDHASLLARNPIYQDLCHSQLEEVSHG